MYHKITKRFAFACMVLGLSATLAFAQAGGGSTGGSTGTADRPGASSGGTSGGSMNDPASQKNMGNTQQMGGQTATQCMPGTGIGAVPCTPVTANPNVTPPGTGPHQGGTVVK